MKVRSHEPLSSPLLVLTIALCAQRPGYVVHDHWLGKNFHHSHEHGRSNVHAYPKALLPQVMLCVSLSFYNTHSSCIAHTDSPLASHVPQVQPALGLRALRDQRLPRERRRPRRL